jgi:hypothetical protein
MAAINAYSQVELRWRNSTRNVAGDEVSSDYFNLLGVHPQLAARGESHPNIVPWNKTN